MKDAPVPLAEQPTAEALEAASAFTISIRPKSRVAGPWPYTTTQLAEAFDRFAEQRAEAYVTGPLPDCMMPDGGEACKAYRQLFAAFAGAETDAFLRGRAVGEKYGAQGQQHERAMAALRRIANINNGPDRASGEWRCQEAAQIAQAALDAAEAGPPEGGDHG